MFFQTTSKRKKKGTWISETNDKLKSNNKLNRSPLSLDRAYIWTAS